MANWHIEELRIALERHGWVVCDELPGDGDEVFWQLRRHGKQTGFVLDFDGIADLRTLPLNECYACSLRETGHSLYFGRRGLKGSDARARWRKDLAAFVEAIGNE